MDAVLKIISMAAITIVLIIAAVIDNKTMRIPNHLTFPMIPVGLIFSFLRSPEDGLYAIITIIVLFFLGMTGFLGMGDLKLAMVIAAFQGPTVTFFTIVAAAVVFVMVHVKRNPFRKVNMKLLLNKKKAEKEGTYLPFAMYMLVGYVVYVGYNVIPPEGFHI